MPSKGQTKWPFSVSQTRHVCTEGSHSTDLHVCATKMWQGIAFYSPNFVQLQTPTADQGVFLTCVRPTTWYCRMRRSPDSPHTGVGEEDPAKGDLVEEAPEAQGRCWSPLVGSNHSKSRRSPSSGSHRRSTSSVPARKHKWRVKKERFGPEGRGRDGW
jgi:hypothetical protein